MLVLCRLSDAPVYTIGSASTTRACAPPSPRLRAARARVLYWRQRASAVMRMLARSAGGDRDSMPTATCVRPQSGTNTDDSSALVLCRRFLRPHCARPASSCIRGMPSRCAVHRHRLHRRGLGSVSPPALDVGLIGGRGRALRVGNSSLHHIPCRAAHESVAQRAIVYRTRHYVWPALAPL